jgi:hypothetical protein
VIFIAFLYFLLGLFVVLTTIIDLLPVPLWIWLIFFVVYTYFAHLLSMTFAVWVVGLADARWASALVGLLTLAGGLGGLKVAYSSDSLELILFSVLTIVGGLAGLYLAQKPGAYRF